MEDNDATAAVDCEKKPTVLIKHKLSHFNNNRKLDEKKIAHLIFLRIIALFGQSLIVWSGHHKIPVPNKTV